MITDRGREWMRNFHPATVKDLGQGAGYWSMRDVGSADHLRGPRNVPQLRLGEPAGQREAADSLPSFLYFDSRLDNLRELVFAA